MLPDAQLFIPTSAPSLYLLSPLYLPSVTRFMVECSKPVNMKFMQLCLLIIYKCCTTFCSIYSCTLAHSHPLCRLIHSRDLFVSTFTHSVSFTHSLSLIFSSSLIPILAAEMASLALGRYTTVWVVRQVLAERPTLQPYHNRHLPNDT